jgi:DNA-binding transcriptional LysR family regulator
MMHRLVAQGAGNRLRIGLPNDYADHFLPVFLGRVEAEALDMRFEVICDISVNLMRDLREGTLDLALAMAQEALPDGAVLHWPERLCWVGVAGREPKSAGQPLALVAAPEGCTYRRAMLSALQREGRQGEIVYTTPSLTGIEAAIRAGFGITAMAERLVPSGLIALSEMPSLPDANAGLYLNPRAQGGQIRLLVAMLGDVLSPRPAAGPAAAFGGTA